MPLASVRSTAESSTIKMVGPDINPTLRWAGYLRVPISLRSRGKRSRLHGSKELVQALLEPVGEFPGPAEVVLARGILQSPDLVDYVFGAEQPKVVRQLVRQGAD